MLSYLLRILWPNLNKLSLKNFVIIVRRQQRVHSLFLFIERVMCMCVIRTYINLIYPIYHSTVLKGKPNTFVVAYSLRKWQVHANSTPSSSVTVIRSGKGNLTLPLCMIFLEKASNTFQTLSLQRGVVLYCVSQIHHLTSDFSWKEVIQNECRKNIHCHNATVTGDQLYTS